MWGCSGLTTPPGPRMSPMGGTQRCSPFLCGGDLSASSLPGTAGVCTVHTSLVSGPRNHVAKSEGRSRKVAWDVRPVPHAGASDRTVTHVVVAVGRTERGTGAPTAGAGQAAAGLLRAQAQPCPGPWPLWASGTFLDLTDDCTEVPCSWGACASPSLPAAPRGERAERPAHARRVARGALGRAFPFCTRV